MKPEEMQKEIQSLKAQVASLLEWKKSQEQNQLKLPVGVSSVQALAQSLVDQPLPKINVKSIFLKTGFSDEPRVDGQIVYKESTDTLRVMLGGVLKTITTA